MKYSEVWKFAAIRHQLTEHLQQSNLRKTLQVTVSNQFHSRITQDNRCKRNKFGKMKTEEDTRVFTRKTKNYKYPNY